MAKNINEFRLKLICKIRQADSEQAISRFIDTAVRTLTKKKVHGHLIVRFLERSIADVQGDEIGTEQDLNQNKFLISLKLLRLAKKNMTEGVN